jgi:hypothetical protein
MQKELKEREAERDKLQQELNNPPHRRLKDICNFISVGLWEAVPMVIQG